MACDLSDALNVGSALASESQPELLAFALIASITVDGLLTAVQKLASRYGVVYIRSRDNHRMDQA